MNEISFLRWTQDLNWVYTRHSEGMQGVFWTSYVPSIYVQHPGGLDFIQQAEFFPTVIFPLLYKPY